MDVFNIDSVGVLIHFINKKSLLPVTELDTEAGRLVEMVGQQVLVGVTSLGSSDPKIRAASKELVERTLPAISPALYRGMTVATVEFGLMGHVMSRGDYEEKDMPVIYVTDTVT